MFWNLGNNHLSDWDEAWYGSIARTIGEQSNYLTPTWNGKPFFDKPPLHYWLGALAYRVLGDSEVAIRFFPALSGVGTVVVVFFLAKTLGDVRAAVMASTVLLSTVGFVSRSRTGNLDTMLAFWISLSMLSWVKAIQTKNDRWYLCMGVSILGAFLTKGFVGFLFPILTMLWLLATKRTWADLRGLLWVTGASALGALAWLAINHAWNGSAANAVFVAHQFEKVSPLTIFSRAPSYEYLLFLKSGLKVWVVVLLVSFVGVRISISAYEKPIALFALVYGGILLISQNKSNWFLVPLYPILALFIGRGIGTLLQRRLPRRLSLWGLAAVVAVGAVQDVSFVGQYWVPDVIRDEAIVAKAAQRFTRPTDILYLTNYYFPTATYYSRRQVYAVYSDHAENMSWWIRPKQDWHRILLSSPVFILCSKQECEELGKEFQQYNYIVLASSGNRQLVKKL